MLQHRPHKTSSFLLAGALVALTLFVSPYAFGADPSEVAKVKAGLQKIQAETKKARYTLKNWEKLGKEESWVRADCYWMGQTTIRMDILDGKGKGGIAILKSGKVTAFLDGFLSFAKLSYDPKDKTVSGIRGLSITESGFMDDIKLILQNWDDGKVNVSGEQAIIDYTGPDKLTTKMWLKSDGSMVTKTETYEKGSVVVRNEYSKVNLSAGFDPKKIFDP